MATDTNLKQFNFTNPLIIVVGVIVLLLIVILTIITILYFMGCFSKKKTKTVKNSTKSTTIPSLSTESKQVTVKIVEPAKSVEKSTHTAISARSQMDTTVTEEGGVDIPLFVPKTPNPQTTFEEMSPEMTITDYIVSRKLLNKFIIDEFKEHYPELPKQTHNNLELQFHKMYILHAVQALNTLTEFALSELEKFGCEWTAGDKFKITNDARTFINHPKTPSFVKIYAIANEYRDIFEYAFDAEFMEKLLRVAPLAIVYVYLLRKKLSFNLRYLVIQILRNRFFDRYKLENKKPINECPQPFEVMHAVLAENPQLRNVPQWRAFQAEIS